MLLPRGPAVAPGRPPDLPPGPGARGRPAADASGLSLRRHLRATMRLAAPVMVSRLGILTIVAADTAMTGWAGARELAALAISAAPHIPLLLIGVGLTMGTMVLAARAEGAGRRRETGFILRAAWRQAWLVGVILLGLFHTGEWLLLAMGQSPSLALEGAQVLAMFGWGMPAVLLFAATTMFLEAIGRPVPGMVCMLAANALNVGLNWMLIYGHLGAPAMGAEGAAAATSIARWATAAALVGWVYATIGGARLGARLRRPRLLAPQRRGAHRAARRLFALGVPIGAAHGLEAGAFASLTVFAGWAGETEVAAFGIVFNLFALPFMPALGLATAANVRVGQACGREDFEAVRGAAWAAVRIVTVLHACIGLGYVLFAPWLAGLYTGDPAVLAIAEPALRLAGALLVLDALQVVLAGCLRGLADVWPATGLFLVSFWGAMAPAAWWLGVRLELGSTGLIGAVGIGCLVAVVLLTLRFRRVLAHATRGPPAARPAGG